jgi:hypothetical protein
MRLQQRPSKQILEASRWKGDDSGLTADWTADAVCWGGFAVLQNTHTRPVFGLHNKTSDGMDTTCSQHPLPWSTPKLCSSSSSSSSRSGSALTSGQAAGRHADCIINTDADDWNTLLCTCIAVWQNGCGIFIKPLLSSRPLRPSPTGRWHD